MKARYPPPVGGNNKRLSHPLSRQQAVNWAADLAVGRKEISVKRPWCSSSVVKASLIVSFLTFAVACTSNDPSSAAQRTLLSAPETLTEAKTTANGPTASPAAPTSATAEPYGGHIASIAVDGLTGGLSIPEDGPNPTLAYCAVSDTCIDPYPPRSDPFTGWAIASLHTETRLSAETTRDLFIQELTETGWHIVQDSFSESTYQGFLSTQINLGAQAPNGVQLDYLTLRIYRSADPAVPYTDIEGYITRDGYCAGEKGGVYTSLLCPEGTYAGSAENLLPSAPDDDETPASSCPNESDLLPNLNQHRDDGISRIDLIECDSGFAAAVGHTPTYGEVLLFKLSEGIWHEIDSAPECVNGTLPTSLEAKACRAG